MFLVNHRCEKSTKITEILKNIKEKFMKNTFLAFYEFLLAVIDVITIH